MNKCESECICAIVSSICCCCYIHNKLLGIYGHRDGTNHVFGFMERSHILINGRGDREWFRDVTRWRYPVVGLRLDSVFDFLMFFCLFVKARYL